MLRAGYGSLIKKILIPLEIQKYSQNGHKELNKFNGVYSRDNLFKKKKRWGICNET